MNLNQKVLVVDDDAQIVQLVRSILEARNFEVFVAGDGEVALKKALTLAPKLIVADIMMPKMDGPAFISELRRRLPEKKIPVIFLTGLVRKAEEISSNHFIGNEYFMAKPFAVSAFLDLVKRAMAEPANGTGRDLQ